MKNKYLKTLVISILFVLSGLVYLADRGHEQSLDGLESSKPQVVSDGAVIPSDSQSAEAFSLTDLSGEQTLEADGEESGETFFRVHVCGAVKRSGVYSLSAGAIVEDAILAAGGVTEDAAGDYLNLADPVHDGDKIYVPALSDTDDPYGLLREQSEGEKNRSEAGTGSGEVSSDGHKVNINTADAKELMTLSGIGESKASAIIAYRAAHGDFGKVSDIMKVPGIKDAAYERIKEQITV